MNKSFWVLKYIFILHFNMCKHSLYLENQYAACETLQQLHPFMGVTAVIDGAVIWDQKMMTKYLMQLTKNLHS